MRRVYQQLAQISAASASSSTTNSPAAAARRKTFPTGIKLLHDAQSSAVDIILIHGLTGHSEKTWTANGAATPWPQTLLPRTIPNARVLTFGYDAYITDWRDMVSEDRIRKHSMNLLTAIATYRANDNTAYRPIVFVCHGLGGLVCQAALQRASTNIEEHLRQIQGLIRGIVFLGTPHHVYALTQWAQILARFIGVLEQIDAGIAAALKSDSEVLTRIQDSFQNLSFTYGIRFAFFYEEVHLPGVGIVVAAHEAVPLGVIPTGIRSNHMDMTKFKDENDPGFVAVTGEIRRWVDYITERRQRALYY
ncbi:hypothetical protein F4861DRAFT_529005 [Xylaria intraflava]|nr:hypothetical protein F4861DRAFT_529005 [Xylaria intraflava]